ncbi:hypothetical protein UNPF46_11525 [Bradyrhizobium sp. UNPF46]|nr:hypothetical protein UNPF46_11525 [Bradyrhizobium sp. UNPF46]
MSEEEDRDRHRELSNLRWEIHKLKTTEAALEERLSQAPPEAVERLREQLGGCKKEIMLATARFTYLEKLDVQSVKSRHEEDELQLERKPTKPRR